MGEGITSLLDWLILTWSLGWTGRPRVLDAREAITSLASMWTLVPEPVWKTSKGNWSPRRPSPDDS